MHARYSFIQTRRTLALLLLALCVGFSGLAVLGFRHAYPAGLRPCFLPSIMMALQAYARDHGGKYPDIRGDPFASLVLLYPVYESRGAVLAGISGNREETVRRLQARQPLDAKVSGWVYWPGFGMDDDPSLAIIWDRTGGLSYNARRASGHAVGFADGTFRQVPAKEWSAFVAAQEALRRNIRWKAERGGKPQ